jgi:hypothetical protein
VEFYGIGRQVNEIAYYIDIDAVGYRGGTSVTMGTVVHVLTHRKCALGANISV